MEKSELDKNFWFIRGPFTKFEESIKEIKKIATINDLRIVDSRYVTRDFIQKYAASKTPELTLKKVQKTTHELEMEAKNKEIEELKAKLEAPSQMADLIAEIALLKKKMSEEKPKKGRPKKEESQEGDKSE